MASRVQRYFPTNQERTNYAKLCRIIVDLCTEGLRNVLSSQISPTQVNATAHGCPRKSLSAQQWVKIHNAPTDGFKNFDITLLYTLLRGVGPGIPAPKSGWGGQTLPQASDIGLGDDIERIRIIRNQMYGHLSNTMVDNSVYQQIVAELRGVMGRFDQELGSSWVQELNLIDTDSIGIGCESQHIQRFKELADSDKDTREQLHIVEGQIENLDERIEALEQDSLRVLTAEAITNSRVTEARLKMHNNDKTFVPSKATDAGIQMLDKHGIVIYKGPAGWGKTSNAKEVMSCLQKRDANIRVFMFSNVFKWNSCINPSIKSVVLLDDCFGKTNIDRSVISDNDIWDIIDACITEGNVKLIMSVRTNIFDEAISVLGVFGLFKEEHIIDLSSDDFKLSLEGKKEILMRHCRNNNISFCDDVKEENYHCDKCLDKKIEVKLSEHTARDIIFTNPYIGFPQSCFLFCRDRTYTQLGHKFFKSPTQSIVDEINNMRKSDKILERQCYCILVYVLLNGEIDLNMLNTELMNNISRNVDISRELRQGDIEDAVNEMKYVYLVNECDSGLYEFRHQTILESLAISSVRCMPSIVLRSCPMRFIDEFIRANEYKEKKGEIVVKLRENSYIPLFDRFIHELMNENAWFANHSVMDDSNFLAKFFDYVKGNSSRSSLVSKSCNKELGIFVISCMFCKKDLVLKLSSSYNIAPEIAKKACKHTIKCGYFNETASYFSRKILEDIFIEQIDIKQCVYRYYPKKKDEISKEYACPSNAILEQILSNELALGTELGHEFQFVPLSTKMSIRRTIISKIRTILPEYFIERIDIDWSIVKYYYVKKDKISKKYACPSEAIFRQILSNELGLGTELGRRFQFVPIGTKMSIRRNILSKIRTLFKKHSLSDRFE